MLRPGETAGPGHNEAAAGQSRNARQIDGKVLGGHRVSDRAHQQLRGGLHELEGELLAGAAEAARAFPEQQLRVDRLAVNLA